MKRMFVCMLMLLAVAAFADTTPVGDGNDGDGATFSFHPESKTGKLVNAQGEQIKPEEVKSLYGKEFTIYCDGVDICSVPYAWKQGFGGDDLLLQPVYMDLSDWNKARVEPGYVAIDPATARIKFAAAHTLPDGKEYKFIKRVQMGNLYGEGYVVRDGFIYATLQEETRGLEIIDARDPMHPKYAGYTPLTGFAGSIAISDTHAYIRKGYYLGIVDIRDPYDAKLVRCMAGFASSGRIRCEGDRLYSFADDGVMLVYDITDRDDPVPITTYRFGESSWDFDMDDKYFYVLQAEEEEEKGAIQILERLENDAFAKTGRLALDSELGWSVVTAGPRMLLDGDRVYITSKAGLEIIDVSDRSNPVLVGTFPDVALDPVRYDQGHGGFSLAKHGKLVVVGCGRSDNSSTCHYWPPIAGLTEGKFFEERKHRGGIWILDVDDPKDVKVVTIIDDLTVGLGALNYVNVDGNTLYCMGWAFGMVMFDISDVKNPKQLGCIPMAGEVENAKFIGDKVYAAGNSLYVMEPYPAEKAELLSYAWVHGWLFGGGVVGRAGSPYVFYMGSSPNRIIDVSEPCKAMIKEYYTVAMIGGKWIGDKLYTARGGARWIQSPSPEFDLIDKYNLPVQPAVELERKEIPSGFVIYDMSNPLNPTRISGYETKEGMGGVTVRGDYAYVVSFDGDRDTKATVLYILDISDEKNIKLVSRWVGEWPDHGEMYSGGLYLKDGYLFLPSINMCTINWGDPEVSNKIRGWRIVDVSDPRNPRLVKAVQAVKKNIHMGGCDAAQNFWVRGNRLYVADYCNGIGVFDISDMKNLPHLAQIRDDKYPWSTFASATSVHGYGRYIYKTMFGGVDIYEIPCPSDVPTGKMMTECRLQRE